MRATVYDEQDRQHQEKIPLLSAIVARSVKMGTTAACIDSSSTMSVPDSGEQDRQHQETTPPLSAIVARSVQEGNHSSLY